MTPEENAKIIDAMARLGELMDFVTVSWLTNLKPGPMHIAIMKDPTAPGFNPYQSHGALGGMVNNATLCKDMPEGPEYSSVNVIAMSHNEFVPAVNCEACIKELFNEFDE